MNSSEVVYANSGRRAIFSIESPLQLLSSIAIVEDEEKNIGFSTLIISRRFRGADCYASRLAETGIFNQVLLSDYSYRNPERAPLLEALRDRGYAPQFVELANKIALSEYDNLFFPGVNNLNLELKSRFVRNGHSELIDDGTGSHNGSIAKAYSLLDPIVNYRKRRYPDRFCARRMAKAVTRLTIGWRYQMDVQAVNLFNPSNADKEQYRKVQVHSLAVPSHLSELGTIFPLTYIHDYAKRRLVYLTLPDNAPEKLLEMEDDIVHALASEYGSELIIRCHPRCQRMNGAMNGALVDRGDGFWELYWAKGLLDEKSILIGMMSSAQVTPKIIANSEPALIFLSKIAFGDKANSHTIKDIMSRYENADRIMVPSNIADMKATVSKGLQSVSEKDLNG